MKQKNLLLLLSIVSSMSAVARDFEYTYEGQTITYTVIDEEAKTCETKGGQYGASGNSISGTLVIPEIAKDGDVNYTVTSIATYSFTSSRELTSVVLPNSVTSIGEYSFGETGLSSVKIPNSVTSIKNGAFWDCASLQSVEIPNSVSSIERNAFKTCPSLTSVKIPASVTFIGAEAFQYCSTLRAGIIYGNNVTIEAGALPDYSYIFASEGLDCSGLNNPIVICDPETITALADGTVLGDNGKTLYLAPFFGYDNSGAEFVPYNTDYTIPDGVEKIKAEAFYNNQIQSYEKSSIPSLTVPSTIKEIEPDAFKSIEIGKVNFTDWSEWYANAKLGNVYSNPYWNSTPYVGGVQMVTPELKNGITEIPDYINYGLQFKGEIEIPRSIKRIGAYAFYNNKELFSVILPKGLEEIGESAFEGCALLENPAFPTGLQKIEMGAYKGCTSITEISLPEGLTVLGDIPAGVEVAEDDATKGVFEGCTSLEKAVTVADIDYLPDNIFKDCTLLDKIYFPLQLKTIGNSAFENCTTLDEITFPATLETIGQKAFRGLNNLNNRGKISKLNIPDGVKTMGKEAFANQSIGNLSIGKGLENIPNRAFFGNSALKVINFSEGLKEIGEYAFANDHDFAVHIGSVILPSSVTRIGDHAFEWNYIGNLVIPDEVEILGSKSCGLPSVLTIGSYVTDIAADAFDFEKLYTIRLKAHMPPAISDAFPLTDEQNDQLTLIVNKGRFSTYDTNPRWKQIDRIIEEGYTEVYVHLDGTYTLAEEIRVQSGYMPSVVTKMKVDGPLTEADLRVIKENMIALTSLDLSEVTNLTEIPAGEFEGSLLTEVILPPNLEAIGDNAFKDCNLLELSELPETVKTIGREAFRGCPKVNVKKLPAALESIGWYAFAESGMSEIVAGEALAEIGWSAFLGCKLLERADLGKTLLTKIEDRVFEGCSELDEVILPSSAEEIGEYAFSGASLRNIDFASEVTKIGNFAFRNNRRLVSATLPESLTEVGSYLFENCPRLISLSMPGGVTNVGEKIVNGDRKLANISCSAEDAPAATTGAFDGVRYRYVTLAIPKLSFRKYISEGQWGKFESTQNSLPLSLSKGIIVTSVAEKEYADMITEDALEAAQDAAAAQNGRISQASVARRAAARAKTVENFATLFDGAQLMPGREGGDIRIFITPEEGVNVTSILFDGEEILSQYDGTSVLIPEGKYGSLEIFTDAKPTVAENIILSDTELTMTVDQSSKITATVEPADTDDKTVVWASGNEEVAVVDANGEVTAVGVGNVVITATCGDIVSECVLKCYPQVGDANWNGSINIVDAVDIANYVVKKKEVPEEWNADEWLEFYTFGANANGSEDGKITFADASATVVLALEDNAAQAIQNRVGAAYAKAVETDDALVIASLTETADGGTAIAIRLDDSMDYVALQADINVPDGWNIDVKAGARASKHSLETRKYDDNHLRFALYNLSNKAFTASDEPIVELVTSARLSDADGMEMFNIIAADAKANEYKLISKSLVESGVEGIAAGDVRIAKSADGVVIYGAAGMEVEIFTLDGKAVKTFVANGDAENVVLSSGLYIVKAGNKTLKVML